MIRVFDARKARKVKAPLLAVGVLLMEWASGVPAFAVLWHLGGSYGRRALALVGRGNNGGDAPFAVVFFARRGMGVVAAIAEDAHGADFAAARAAGHAVFDVADTDAIVREAVQADVWIDRIPGVGARGEPCRPLVSFVERLEGSREDSASSPEAGRSVEVGPLVIAVDVPPGVGTDDGAAPDPILRADFTVTMGAPKPGLPPDPAHRYTGRAKTADIGLCLSAAARAVGCATFDVTDIGSGSSSPDLVSIERADLPLLWPVPGPSSHKYTRGVVGVAAGSASYPGTGLLCVDAVLAAGPGMVRYAGTLGLAVVSSYPEAVPGEGRVDAWVIGPGPDRGALVRAEPIVDGPRSEGWTMPAVLDAGALAWAERGMTSATIPTLHAGELAALFSRLEIEGSCEGVAAYPAAAAKLASESTGATAVFKGPVDVVVSPGGPVCAQSGPTWRTAVGTSGIYAGLLGALLVAGFESARAMAAVVCARGLASENGPMRVSDIVRDAPTVVRVVLAGGGSEEGFGFYVPDVFASAFHMWGVRVNGGRRGAWRAGGAR